MANTSTRTLRLLSLLQARRYWPGNELAERLRASPRTLRLDIDRRHTQQESAAYPVRGRGGGHSEPAALAHGATYHGNQVLPR